MEVSRLGGESELQLPAYTTATAMWELSHSCDLHRSSWQYWILNPLSEARDWTCILTDISLVLNPLSHNSNFSHHFFIVRNSRQAVATWGLSCVFPLSLSFPSPTVGSNSCQKTRGFLLPPCASPTVPGWARCASWSRMFWIRPRRGSWPWVCWPQARPSCWWRSRTWCSGALPERSRSCPPCRGAPGTRPHGRRCELARPCQNGWGAGAAAHTGTHICWAWKCGLSLDGGKGKGCWGGTGGAPRLPLRVPRAEHQDLRGPVSLWLHTQLWEARLNAAWLNDRFANSMQKMKCSQWKILQKRFKTRTQKLQNAAEAKDPYQWRASPCSWVRR